MDLASVPTHTINQQYFVSIPDRDSWILQDCGGGYGNSSSLVSIPDRDSWILQGRILKALLYLVFTVRLRLPHNLKAGSTKNQYPKIPKPAPSKVRLPMQIDKSLGYLLNKGLRDSKFICKFYS